MNSAPQRKHENGVFDTSILMLNPDTILFLQHSTDS
jgi:hypothetical protein